MLLRIFDSLHYRSFRLVWLGSVTEHTGEFMEVGAIFWLVNELTHSPLMLTIVGSCRYAVMILFPIIGGVAADRMDRRRLLIISLLGSAFLSVCLAVLVFTDLVAISHLIIISLLGGVAMSFNHPARQSIVPNLVKKEHLLNAISLDTISVQASRLVGMSLVGYVITMMGTWPIFIMRALGCLLAIFWLSLAMIPPTPGTTNVQTPWQNLAEGFHYLRGNTLLIGLILLFLIPMLSSNTYGSFLPVVAEDILHIGAVGYGYLQAMPGLGAIFALIGLTLLTHYKWKVKLFLVAGVVMGISLFGFSTSSWVFLSLPLLVVIGGMNTALMALNMTLIQGNVSDELRGRVISWREIAFGLGPTGSILFGAIARYTGVPFSLGLLGGFCLVVFLVLIIFLPRFRDLE